MRHHSEPNRVLTTVLFVDIVDSTAKIAEIGDPRWRDLKARYLALASREIERYRSRFVDSAGACSPPSMGPPARSAAREQSVMASIGLVLRCGLDCTPVKSKWPATASLASRCTLARASWHLPRPEACSSPVRSRILLRGPASSFTMPAVISSRAYLVNGRSMKSCVNDNDWREPSQRWTP